VAVGADFDLDLGLVERVLKVLPQPQVTVASTYWDEYRLSCLTHSFRLVLKIGPAEPGKGPRVAGIQLV